MLINFDDNYILKILKFYHAHFNFIIMTMNLKKEQIDYLSITY